jgi:2-polyprenyl-3-methyl-5-hydroxy-6-metoxy-1,4-benzoquinol methylase
VTDLNNSALNEISVNPPNENELTSESFWTGVWGAHPPRRRRSWLRQRLKQLAARHSDRMFAKFVEITGSPAGDLLEIGCAPGATLEEIHRACPQLRLHGIDYSESGLEMARRRLNELQIEATLHCGDAFHAQLPQRYDIVLSTGVIEHFIDPVPIIKCHARLAKPLGHVVVTVPNCASPIPHYFLKVFDPELLAAHNLETMNVARLRELMHEAGLADVRAGRCGPPSLHDRAAEGKTLGKVYVTLARTWNHAVFLLPVPPVWPAYYWAVGRVRTEAAGGRVDS